MNVPTAMWSGGRDLLGDPTDTENLAAKTPNLVYHEKIPDYDHLGFILGLDVPIKVYQKVIEFINKDRSE